MNEYSIFVVVKQKHFIIFDIIHTTCTLKINRVHTKIIYASDVSTLFLSGTVWVCVCIIQIKIKVKIKYPIALSPVCAWNI